MVTLAKDEFLEAYQWTIVDHFFNTCFGGEMDSEKMVNSLVQMWASLDHKVCDIEDGALFQR